MHTPSRALRIAAALTTVALTATACTQTENTAENTAENTTETSASATQVEQTQAYLDTFGTMLQQHWPVAESIWPGVDYTQHVAVVFKLDTNGEPEQAWAFDTNGKRELSKQETAELTPPEAGGYSEGMLGERSAVLLSINEETMAEDPSAEDLYRFATHELVHFYHQPNLTETAEEGSRSESYPIDATPRVMRQMLYHNLVQAVQHPEQQEEYLQHAKFWHTKWKEQFPEEAQGIAWVDIAEGHARYIENFLTFQTPNSTPEELRAGALDNIKEDTFTSADKESYEIGYVASLLLDATQPDWKQHFLAENITQVDKLLADVTPAEQPIDPTVEASVQETIKEANEELAPYMEMLKAADTDADVPYFAVNITSTNGSFYSKSFVNYEGKDAVAGFVGQYSVGGGELSANDTGVWMQGTEILIPLPAGTEAEGGTLNVDTEKVKAKGVKVTSETNDAGRTIFRPAD